MILKIIVILIVLVLLMILIILGCNKTKKPKHEFSHQWCSQAQTNISYCSMLWAMTMARAVRSKNSTVGICISVYCAGSSAMAASLLCFLRCDRLLFDLLHGDL